jgi:hypothetical protein
MQKNITFSAEDTVIRRARDRARRRHTTLNEEFRLWLERYASREDKAAEYEALMARCSYADAGRSFSRDELNER